MPIPIVAQEFNATAEGSVLKEVTCQQCQTEYVYVLERVAKGAGTSVYFLDNAGAKRRAKASAEKRLERLLRKEIDVVPCPVCGRVQDGMVRLARSRRLRWLQWLGAMLVVAAAFIGFLNYFMSDNPKYPQIVEWDDFWPYALIGPAVLLLRFVLVRMHDPNADPEQNIERAREWAMRKEEYERRSDQV